MAAEQGGGEGRTGGTGPLDSLANPARPDPPEPERIAQFRIVGRLGAGGMGVVYRAEDESLRRTVALKLLTNASGSEEKRQRFLREARSAAAITHPNVAMVHQVGEAEGRVYIAMELVDGESLRDALARGPFDVDHARELALQMARGLSAAHDKGIIHRDLKPENVMITRDGVVKLLDFGLAKAAGDLPRTTRADAALAKTETLVTSDDGRILGTPEYMSPEQAMGLPLDTRSDVFAFGMVLYEMLAGVRPFPADNAGAALIAIARDPAVPLREAAAHVDEATADLVMRCLAKEPHLRFANAGEIVGALGGRTAPVSPRATTRSSHKDLPPVAQTRSMPPPPGPWWGARGARVGLGLAVLTVAVGAAALRLSARPSPSTQLPSTRVAPAPIPPAFHERRLTAYPAENLVKDAALTPDGASLVFSDNDGFWVQPVRGGPRRALGVPVGRGDRPGHLSLFGDGTRLLAEIIRGDHHTVWLTPLDGTAAHVTGDGLGAPAWVSPDGQRVAVARPGRSVEVGPLEGGAWTKVATLRTWLSTLRWSPDGRFIAYVDFDTLYVAKADGTLTQTVYSDPHLYMGGDVALAWPEPGRIVFGARDSDTHASVLRELMLDGEGRAASAPRDLWKTRASTISGLTIAGGRLSFVVLEEQNDVYLARLGSGARTLQGPPERLTMSDAYDGFPQWLPDGRLSFLSQRDLGSAIYAQTPGKPDAQLLVAEPVMRGPTEVWGDGALLYRRPLDLGGGLGLQDPGRLLLRRAGSGTEAGSGNEHEVTRGASMSQRIACARGASGPCVLGQIRGGRLTVAKMDPAGGDLEPPFFEADAEANMGEVPGLALSPDGSTLVYVDQGPRLTTVRLADGQPHVVLTSPAIAHLEYAAFTPDGKGLVVTGGGGAEAEYVMAHVDFAGHADVLLGAKNTWLALPSVSFDGRWLALQEQVYDTDVWLLEPP